MGLPRPTRAAASGVTGFDAALSLVVTAAGVVIAGHEADGGLSPIGVVFSLIAGLALLQRRRFPVATAAVVLAARLGLAVAIDSEFALLPASLLALYSLARYRSGFGPLAVVQVIAVIGISLATTFIYYDEVYLSEVFGELARALAAIALGDAVRTRAEQLDLRIDAEAEARVHAERLRIARDLHDVVAHGLSVISVQSGVASHLLDSDPDNARQSIDAINITGKKTLEELRSMVGVLRSTDETPLRPTPTDPDDLTDLLESAERSGLRVTVSIEGSFPSDASEASVVAMHRIAQEALTNVARHAGAVDVNLTVRHRDTAVVCRIANAPGEANSDAAASTGVGIIGMIERAHSVGGTVQTGPTPSGGFAVLAELPYRRSP